MLSYRGSKSIIPKEINGYDIAKGIGIILMVIGHSKCPVFFKTLIYQFHMPLFFIIAGMLYNKSKWENLGYFELVKKRMKSYIFCYFFLSGINLILNAINELEKYTTANDWLDSQIYHIGWIVYASSKSFQNPNCSPLWFLPCLFIAYLIFYLVMCLKIGTQFCVCVCLILFNRFVFYTIPDISPKTLPWHIEVALIGVVLMVIGYYAKSYKWQKVFEENILMWSLLLGVGTLSGYLNWRMGGGKWVNVALASNRVGNPLLFLICSCAVSLDLIALSNKMTTTFLGRCLAFCGKSTMIFIGFNYYFNTISTKIWKKIPVLNQLEYKWWIKSIIVIAYLVLTSYSIKKCLQDN